MSARSTELLDEILSLPPQERAQLAERILDSLAPESAHAIEQMCANEAEARLDAYHHGEIEALSGEEEAVWTAEASRRRDEVRGGRVETTPGDDALRNVRESLRR